ERAAALDSRDARADRARVVASAPAPQAVANAGRAAARVLILPADRLHAGPGPLLPLRGHPVRRATNIVNGIDVSAHAGLVARQARRYRAFIGGSIEWEDLCQAGWFGVIHAAEKFDHARG